MDKQLKEQIKTVFDVPAPTGKTGFFQSVNFPKINRLDFILAQIGYIRKRVWFISCLLVAVTLFGLRFWSADDNSLNLIWIISSMLPYVSLVIVTEIAKSASYCMEELEISCRYNLADIVLVRLGILSCFNTAVFTLIMLLLINEISIDIFRLVLHLFVPFILTCSLSLFVLNRMHSREAVYICGGISCFFGTANALLFNQYYIVFTNKYLPPWGAAFVILMIFTIKESIKLIKKTEELQWNLS